jgi:hypothetical protein
MARARLLFQRYIQKAENVALQDIGLTKVHAKDQYCKL